MRAGRKKDDGRHIPVGHGVFRPPTLDERCSMCPRTRSASSREAAAMCRETDRDGSPTTGLRWHRLPIGAGPATSVKSSIAGMTAWIDRRVVGKEFDRSASNRVVARSLAPLGLLKERSRISFSFSMRSKSASSDHTSAPSFAQQPRRLADLQRRSAHPASPARLTQRSIVAHVASVGIQDRQRR